MFVAPIDYPIVEHPDILVALSQEAYSKFRPTATSDALILIDEELVVPFLKDAPYRIPATRLAEELGRACRECRHAGILHGCHAPDRANGDAAGDTDFG